MSNHTARDLALYFLGIVYKDQKLEPKVVAKTVNQAKRLMSSYQEEDLIEAIQHYTENPPGGNTVYSLGFFFYVMDDFVDLKLKKIELKKKKEEFDSKLAGGDNNNHEKAGRRANKRRLREKYNFDMFEGTREDS